MGVFEAGAMAIRGHWDCFDRAIGAIEDIEERLEGTEILVEYHHKRTCADGEHEVSAHYHNPKGDMQAQLASAKEMIAGACQIAQNVMSEIP